MTNVPSTSPSLLLRLANDPEDVAAWEAFVDRYGRTILLWCRAHRLQDADAEDVTQNLMIALLASLRKFVYDPSKGRFRDWLRRVLAHEVCDFLQKRLRTPTVGGDGRFQGILDAVEARETLVERIIEEFDLELLEEAETRVRPTVQPATWEAFCLLAKEGLTAEEVASRVGMTPSQTFVARSRVQKKLRNEVRRLEERRGKNEP